MWIMGGVSWIFIWYLFFIEYFCEIIFSCILLSWKLQSLEIGDDNDGYHFSFLWVCYYYLGVSINQFHLKEGWVIICFLELAEEIWLQFDLGFFQTFCGLLLENLSSFYELFRTLPRLFCKIGTSCYVWVFFSTIHLIWSTGLWNRWKHNSIFTCSFLFIFYSNNRSLGWLLFE